MMRSRHRLQQHIAHQVAQRVVDALEVVEVDEQQRQRLPPAVAAGQQGLRSAR
jgi:ABC-type microcin C transport system duplicated ATPase subunit YejF